MWVAAEPVARKWIEDNLGPIGRLREAGEGASAIGKIIADLPALLTQGQQTAIALHDMARNGLRLDDETMRKLAWRRPAAPAGAASPCGSAPSASPCLPSPS